MPYKDPVMERARRRNREHMKRTTVSDITHAQEQEMRRKARRCPMAGCGVKLTDKPHLPNSKELDHIVPINQGGTHTHGNVRIICRKCNQSRPKDGSDYAGPVTLWAQGEPVVARVRLTCRNGLHPWIPENIETTGRQRRCRLCTRASKRRVYAKKRPMRACKCGALFAAPGGTLMCPACTEAAGRKAAELHAAGGVSWDQVAAEVGYGSGEGARYAAKRIGYVPEPKPPAPKELRRCPCGGPVWRQGRCADCMSAHAQRAIHLRTVEGWTLRMIADELGYTSITTVTNLMKTVITIESRMGRPRRAA